MDIDYVADIRLCIVVLHGYVYDHVSTFEICEKLRVN
jgi:hypothetical protein